MRATSRDSADILVVGALPPPLFGMTVVTAEMARRIGERATASVVDISPGGYRRGVRYHLRKIAGVVRSWGGLLRNRGRGVLYMPLDGGWGLLYNASIVSLARGLGYRMFLHHHNYAYLTRRSRRLGLVAWLAGARAVHIVLCESMERDARRRYAGIQDARVLGNAVFIGVAARAPTHPSPGDGLRVGHLGLLGHAKGTDLAVRSVAALRAAGHPARLVLAGPVVSRGAAEIVETARRLLGSALDVRGPIGDQEKPRFFGDVDVLLFPSRLSEAAPLVILESLAYGVPVVASGGGCIPTMLGHGCGVALPDSASFAEDALDVLRSWAQNPDALLRASTRAAARYRELWSVDAERLEPLLEEIVRSAEHREAPPRPAAKPEPR